MNARELINQVEELGITLRVVGDKLRLKAQLGIITPEIRAELSSHKAEIIEALLEPASRSSATRVYKVVIDTDGVHKGMTVIDPSGNGFEEFQQSCRRRFGPDRVISIKLRLKKPRR